MKFEISGVDRQGKERTVSVTAIDEKVALAKAKTAGITAFAVKMSHEEQARPIGPQPQTHEDIKPDEYYNGPFIYKMFQLAPTISVKEGVKTSQLAAHYLEDVVGRFAKEGWEFFRVDEIGIDVRPGCLAALFGVGAVRHSYYVITFRQPVKQETSEE
jgi:hypothetical protein